MSKEHIVRSYSEELRRLTTLITQMGGIAEAQVETAVRAVAKRDADLAASVIKSDERLDQYERDIDAEAIRMLALRQPTGGIPRMGKLVQEIMKDVLDAYIDRDLDKAIAAWRRDEELDDLYTSLFREVLTYMMEDPRNITPCTHLLFIAKNLERVGDHATNIAETLHFVVIGHSLKTARPKGDASSFAVVTPGGDGADASLREEP